MTAASNESVLLRRDESRVAFLTLNRPRAMNALSGELIDALQTEFDRLAGDAAIRCVVIEAQGDRAFSTGHDLREVASTRDYAFHHSLMTRCSAMMLSIGRLPQPVIAKVKAVATAAGCQLVAACDLAVASSDATFATSGINNGLFCGTPSVAVGRNIGPKRALDMLFTGTFVDAATAMRDGLVSRVVPAADLDRETKALAERIASQPPQQIASGKAMFRKHMEMNVEQAYAYATDYMAGAIQREDAQAGIDAFVNKRPKPDWTGK
ncbi:enoyl-CoA hydratase [Reyranella sp. MMS21-HV4-11]|uniref:Enoyl-CoA hydratase n=1 Tax=Reyranella humidisoli TaxID=2849149 RepID=A0ABS6IS65_9HYPH|nr:enoyl-CoA hydratase [Reyranella sp. MMS21-HV4-11]MBU8876889.1 enoyl-CoA hydratase [Reyranella sp. MMS21-HV4-11]